MPRTADPVACPDFLTTHWSVVLAAQHDSSPDADAALESLCQSYWYPLYAYVRRCGHNAHDAQDLTQEFFARLLAKDWLVYGAIADENQNRHEETRCSSRLTHVSSCLPENRFRLALNQRKHLTILQTSCGPSALI